MFKINKHAAKAQMESDEVEADNVRSTGDKDSKARKTKIDDFSVLDPILKCPHTLRQSAMKRKRHDLFTHYVPYPHYNQT